jgi:hypothetical protein
MKQNSKNLFILLTSLLLAYIIVNLIFSSTSKKPSPQNQQRSASSKCGGMTSDPGNGYDLDLCLNYLNGYGGDSLACNSNCDINEKKDDCYVFYRDTGLDGQFHYMNSVEGNCSGCVPKCLN